jgi:molybdopterin converting factor small subunit
MTRVITCTIELYGISAELTGKNEVKLEFPMETAGMQELVIALKTRLPELDGIVIKNDTNLLAADQAFNKDGRFYTFTDEIMVRDGDRIRLLTAAVGG